MLVRVAFLPRALPPIEGDVVIVIDVLRATTTLVALFEAGAATVTLVEDDEFGPQLAGPLPPETLLCGEEIDGDPAPGCLLGRNTSPAVSSEMHLRDRQRSRRTPRVLVDAPAEPILADDLPGREDGAPAGKRWAQVTNQLDAGLVLVVHDHAPAGLVVVPLVEAQAPGPVQLGLRPLDHDRLNRGGEELGVGVLRRAWLNLAFLWATAIATAGLLTLFT